MNDTTFDLTIPGTNHFGFFLPFAGALHIANGILNLLGANPVLGILLIVTGVFLLTG